jgi:hypothetical protein
VAIAQKLPSQQLAHSKARTGTLGGATENGPFSVWEFGANGTASAHFGISCETFSEQATCLFAEILHQVLAKHSKTFSLIDCVSVGVDRMQRNFEPMRQQVEARQSSEHTNVTATKAQPDSPRPRV